MVLFNLNQQAVTLIVYFLVGVMVGSLLPDVDASDAKIMHGEYRAIGLFGKYLFYKPIARLLGSKSEAYQERHRGFLHSLIGLLLATLYFIIPVAIIFIVLTFIFLVPLHLTLLFWYALLGLPFGFLLHLAEDSFTKSGIRWFYPKGQPMKSSITTGRKSENYMLTAIFFTYGIFTIIVYLQPPSLIILILTIVITIILLAILYALSPLIARLSKD
jgi:inner membrane protein